MKLKLWHNDWEDFVLADENPGNHTLAEDETEVDIFLAIMTTKETADSEVQRVHELHIDDVNSTAYQCDDFYFVVTIDWCGSDGLIKGLYN